MPTSKVVSIVDDDASIRGATAKLVRLNGFTTVVFSSAEEFLQSARLRDTCCLITDVKMPGMSGIDLQRRLIEQGSAIPIIFITAFPDEANEAQAMDAGATCVLAKPFDAQSLIDCLSLALQPQNNTRAD